MNIHPTLKPDAAAMREHLTHLFGHHSEVSDGKIELTWTDERGAPRFAEYFDTDQVDPLVERAVKLNSNSGTNVYIGAALRDPDCPPMGRSNDDDFYALTAVYVDLDDPGAAEKARSIYGDLKPTFAVITGMLPYLRAQLWWRLEEPITDPQESEALLRAMAVALGGDVKVCNPGRVMRLGGSIAWPVKDGRVIELTRTQHIYRADVTLEQIEAEFPGGDTHASNQHSSEQDKREEVRAKTGLGLDGDVVDGRETYMRDTVMAVFIELTGTTGSIPEAQELFDAAWPQYERNTDFSRPGRGKDEFAAKCEYTIKRFNQGRLPGLKKIEDVVEAYHARPRQDGVKLESDRAKTEWQEPDWRFLREELPPPPELPLDEVFSETWAKWIRDAAECKAAPPDYVVFTVFTVFSTLIGNARWVSPWSGWREPPILWSMLIGLPSSSKSPAMDAVLSPLKQVENELRTGAEEELADWRKMAELAKLVEAKWKEDVKKALLKGKEPPAKPDAAYPGSEPHLPCLAVSDATIEKLAIIVSNQPKGVLMFRDELAGWLQSMTRYSGGGSDRPFWLETYGGRSYTQQRIGRDPVHVQHLSIGVTGGIQPERLKDLLTQDDDGLTARLLPIWPKPAPVRRPSTTIDDTFIQRSIRRLMSLNMIPNGEGQNLPGTIVFDEGTMSLMDELRERTRQLETETDGLLRSFIGKLPGTTARLSLVLAYTDWSCGKGPEPAGIGVDHFGRAMCMVESYLLPMARRAYAEASESAAEKAARSLVRLIQERGWNEFSSSEVYKLNRKGLTSAKEVDKAIIILDEADIVRLIPTPTQPQGGRPKKRYRVNPAIWQVMKDAT